MLLTWSGGCDSTYLLNYLCQYATKDSPVRTISINHPQIAAYDMQVMARQRILEELIDNRHYHIDHTEVEIINNGPASCVSGTGSNQAAIWVSMALLYLNEGEDLYLGFIKKDDIWHSWPHMKTMFEEGLKLMGKTGKLNLHTEHLTKWEILKGLKEDKLLDMTWHCEDDSLTPCGRCISCETHQVALYQLDKFHSNQNLTVKEV